MLSKVRVSYNNAFRKCLGYPHDCSASGMLSGVMPQSDFVSFQLEYLPPELVLNLENEVETKATFLDLDIEIKDKQFTTKIFDKRDQFKFEIISYPDFRRNIPVFQ